MARPKATIYTMELVLLIVVQQPASAASRAVKPMLFQQLPDPANLTPHPEA